VHYLSTAVGRHLACARASGYRTPALFAYC
jgi:hypothetical protein